MTTSRLFYANLLSPTKPVSFNLAGGAVAYAPVPASQAYPVYTYAAGNASLAVQGTFTGALPMRYVVQVTSSTDGTFANTRYQWSDTDGDVWNVSNLTPVSGGVVSLSNGVQIIFTASSLAPEFVVADEWDFLAVRKYPITNALDGSRNSEYRSGTTPANSTIRVGWDLGSSQQPQCFVLDDHNLPSNAVTTLWGNSALFTESGGFSQVCTWRANRLVELITPGAFRYWWWKVVLPASPTLAYLRWSEAFLGTGATLALPSSLGYSADEQWLGSLDVPGQATRGAQPRVYSAMMTQRAWEGRKRGPTEDGGKLEAALAYARDHASGQLPPFYFLAFDDDLTTMELVSWAGDLGRKNLFLDRFDYQTTWAQVIRTVAS